MPSPQISISPPSGLPRPCGTWPPALSRGRRPGAFGAKDVMEAGYANLDAVVSDVGQ